jgi:hypothetical protein
VPCERAEALRDAYLALIYASKDAQWQLNANVRDAIARPQLVLQRRLIEWDLKKARQEYWDHVKMHGCRKN